MTALAAPAEISPLLIGGDASSHLRLLRQKHPALSQQRSSRRASSAQSLGDEREDVEVLPDGEVVCTLIQALVGPDWEEAAFAQELRRACPSCGRCFSAEAALRHFPICKKVHSARQNSWSSEATASESSSLNSPRKGFPGVLSSSLGGGGIISEQPLMSSRSNRGRDSAFASAASVVLSTPRANCPGHGFPGVGRLEGRINSSLSLLSCDDVFSEAPMLSAR
mmetsp:Transcript_57155/g.121514  ORF Transcript_57155/g.121514 Transcript_57155/m.121514 type:complete len:223 (-) Transcript_57155:262-930(-)|eukprot:CAMPEP_0206493744 /NCGR_PEP_ID=MMETSP0324_2-20121206/47212_1 /ASSEMBLY_ACC=CAM_ASM_000836 /TAXON_ID=2866 /ORGANISM="Crypthecodinium cohnii, Strain Seligo" /LENGTH=222 /DNA_ID=CAMNT_0053977061 /DNA_START=198 /DNA_END=866 /DNA_ORIENTATION=+